MANDNSYVNRTFIAIVLIFSIFFVLVKSCGFNSGKEVGKLETQIEQITQVNEHNTQVIEVQEKIGEIKDTAVKETVIEEKKVAEKTATRIKKTKSKTDAIEKDHTLTPDQRDLLIAEVQVDSLWEAYNDASHVPPVSNPEVPS